MLKYYKYFIKKKKFYYSLVLYFVLLNYKVLLFFQKNNINYQKSLRCLSDLSIKYFKLNSSNISPVFKNINNNFISNILKKDLLLVYFNNFSIILKIFDNAFISNAIFASINYYFLNIKFLKNINHYYLLFNCNFILFSVFIFKLFYIFITYKKKILQISF